MKVFNTNVGALTLTTPLANSVSQVFLNFIILRLVIMYVLLLDTKDITRLTLQI